MNSFEKKEQNLNQLIDKLNSMSLSYSQPTSELEDKFNQDIEELSQETESLVKEIDKWQM